MDELRTYRIEIQGRADENDLNAISPFQMTVVRADAESTLLTVSTDQSGLVGVLRHLHSRGLVLRSVRSEKVNKRKEIRNVTTCTQLNDR